MFPLHRRPLVLLLALALLGGCDDGIPSSTGESTIEAELFITTMVELRKAALIRESQVIPGEERDRVLREQGVTAEQLTHFVEVHGGNVPFMTRVWGHVEQRLNEATYEEYRNTPDA